MPRQVTYTIQVEFSDFENEDDYLEVRDSVQGWLENAVEWPDVKLVGSDIEIEEYIDD